MVPEAAEHSVVHERVPYRNGSCNVTHTCIITFAHVSRFLWLLLIVYISVILYNPEFLNTMKQNDVHPFCFPSAHDTLTSAC